MRLCLGVDTDRHHRCGVARLRLHINPVSGTCTASPLSRANPARLRPPSPPARLPPPPLSLARAAPSSSSTLPACPRGGEGVVVGVLRYGMVAAAEIREGWDGGAEEALLVYFF
jgi:hypothetical protein